MHSSIDTETAIIVLKNLQDWLYFSPINGGTKIQREAIDIAIKALEEKEKLLLEPVNSGYLVDWFINSVGDEEPVWTEGHIDELINDFYIIPKIEKGEHDG